ncbi:MAG: MBL fold metallo-hydrolase [Persicimonas sp.]
MSFQLLMNGVGNAFSRESYGTNFLLQKDDFLLAIDCPDSYRNALQDHRFEHGGEEVDVDKIDAIIITHLHGDHVNGLEMSLAYRRYVAGGRWHIYTSPDVVESLWDKRLEVSLGRSYNGKSYDTLGPEDYYELDVIEWGEPTRIGPFEITSRCTTHHLPTMALRISDGEHTLGYSCDTVFDEGLIDWLSGADMILHETSFGPGHTPLEKLMGLAEDLREKMLVVHLPEGFQPIEALEFGQEGKTYSVG